MNVFIPVLENKGLQSEISPHFGSAPTFVVVDTEDGQCRALQNRDLHHSHGMCHPLASLEGVTIDAVVTRGIGGGALSKLSAAGLDVYNSEQETVGEALAALQGGKLERVDPAITCGHHGHGHHASCCHAEASAP